MAESGSASIEIAASAAEILDVVCDVESYPDWMEAFHKAAILETDGKGRPVKAEFTVDARIKTVDYVLAYKYPKGGVAWELVEGDVREIEGSYTFESSDRGITKVTYSYSIDPGFPMPGFLRRQAVKMMVSSALNDLKKRVEELQED